MTDRPGSFFSYEKERFENHVRSVRDLTTCSEPWFLCVCDLLWIRDLDLRPVWWASTYVALITSRIAACSTGNLVLNLNSAGQAGNFIYSTPNHLCSVCEPELRQWVVSHTCFFKIPHWYCRSVLLRLCFLLMMFMMSRSSSHFKRILPAHACITNSDSCFSDSRCRSDLVNTELTYVCV